MKEELHEQIRKKFYEIVKLKLSSYEPIFQSWKKMKGDRWQATRSDQDQRNEYLESFARFSRYMAIAGIVDFPAVPYEDMDLIWHASLEHEVIYQAFCIMTFKRVLPHRPFDGSQQMRESNAINRERTEELYNKVFSNDAYNPNDYEDENYGTCSSCDCCP